MQCKISLLQPSIISIIQKTYPLLLITCHTTLTNFLQQRPAHNKKNYSRSTVFPNLFKSRTFFRPLFLRRLKID